MTLALLWLIVVSIGGAAMLWTPLGVIVFFLWAALFVWATY